MLHGVIDMAELPIPIGMIFSFFGLAIALQTVAQMVQDLGHFGMADRMLASAQGIGDGARTLVVQRSGDSGSPRVVSSIIASSLCTSCGSDWVIGLRPPPGRRIRPGQVNPASISPIPLWMALRDKPHARLTRLTPPRPKDLASLAAVRRRVRSSKCGQMA